MTVVLVADDEASLRLLVRATISSKTCTVIEASDGEAAWAMIQAQHPPVVLLDVQMPGLTGLDVVRAIRADSVLRDIHVVLLTSKAQEADIRAGIAAGADHYLTKPFSPLELLTVVERALGAL